MKQKNNLPKLLACICFALMLGNTIAQTATQKANHEKYWNYRERMKRYFIKIGPDQGESVPANWFYSYPNNNDVVMNWGDATSWLGMYYAVLAMEYKISDSENKPTKGTLNELYYAINAFNRLDDVDRHYYDINISGNFRDGFFIRDDVPANFKDNWTSQYATVKDDRYNLSAINSSFSNAFPSGWAKSTENEVSQDQLIDIFYGLRYVVDMIPANLTVQPTPADAPINLVSEAKAIVNRIMGQLTIFHSLHPDANWQTERHLGAHADGDVRANWILVNPVTGLRDHAGSEPRPLAYGIASAADRIVGGNSWVGIGVRHKEVDQPGDGYYGAAYDATIPLSTIKANVWDNLETFVPNPNNIGVDFPQETCLGLPNSIKQTFNNGDDLCFTTDKNFITGPGGIVQPNTALMSLYLAVTGNSWTHNNILSKAMPYKMYPFDLADAVLNGNAASNSQSFYETILASAPCNGPYKYDNISNYSAEWNTSDRWEHPLYTSTPDENFTGDYIGMDYMILYNLYHLYYKNQTTLPSYDASTACDCNNNPAIEKGLTPLSSTDINTNVNVVRRFPQYSNFSIYLDEFITHPINIKAGGTINNKTTLILCNSTVDVSNGGTFKNGNNLNAIDSVKIIVRNGSQINIDNNGTLDVTNNTKVIIQKGASLKATNANAKIIVRSGGKLVIEPGAFLELNNGSKLIVEDGGQVIIQANLSNPNATINGLLTYNQGAVIQLKGDNAVLEINGRVHIGDNATFGFTYPGSNSGYIKFNRGQGVWWDNWAPNNAHITCGTNARINLQGQSKTDKMIDISQINVAIPKNLTQFVMAKCQVDFNDNDAQLETDRPTFINNSTFTRGNVINGRAGRGLLVFGQSTCVINKCDFIKLHRGITGALFYSGTKLTGVINCYFFDCTNGVLTYGGGMNTSNNNFLNVADPIESVDATANSFISNNIVNTNSQNQTNYYALGIGTHGANVEFDIQKNTVNNVDYALITNNSNIKLKCNDLQNNVVGLLAVDNAKVNMSDLLGAGYNNANNCGTFAQFMEANAFDADQGFNNFQIANGGPCTWVPPVNHFPFTPGYFICPTIMEGSLINFVDFNPLPPSHNYQIFAEQNFWRPLGSATDAIENRQNKVRKIDLTDLNNPIIDSASVFTGNVLTNTSLVTCPTNGGGGTNCNGAPCRIAVHPLDDNSNSSIITTASFYNKKLQKALQFSLNKMDKMQNSNKVNQAADLLTECLTYNYATPVTNSVDKYLLELAYQKLFTCVAQLAEWHRDSAITFNPMPATLQSRFNDLHTICALRAGRKSISETDYKEINDLILLDKAMIYRISDNRQLALNLVNNIIASSPKATHVNMYENFRCIWSTEIEAINGNIPVYEALEQIKLCTEKYSNIPKQTSSTARKINPTQKSEVVYANEHAIAVFPNPTYGNLSIAYSLVEFKSITLEIFDAQGKMMGIYNLSPEEKTLNIDNLNLENGVYFYTIKGDGKNLMSKKLVVVN